MPSLKKIFENSVLVISLIVIIFNVFIYLEVSKKKPNEDEVVSYLIDNPANLESALNKINSLKEDNNKKNIHIHYNEIKNNHEFFLGNKNGETIIIEFFDYNCGYCKSVVKTIMDVMSEDKKVNLVFVELPILSQNSYIAATAALASEKQGLYNDYHLSLMSVKGRINEDVIFKIAKKTGLNINQLKIDMKKLEIENKLTKNREIAKLLNLNGTPAFIVGDIIYPGALQKSDLKQIIKSFREK